MSVTPAQQIVWPIGNTPAPIFLVPATCHSLATISEGNPIPYCSSWRVRMVERLMTELSDKRYETWLTICGLSWAASLLLAGTV